MHVYATRMRENSKSNSKFKVLVCFTYLAVYNFQATHLLYISTILIHCLENRWKSQSFGNLPWVLNIDNCLTGVMK